MDVEQDRGVLSDAEGRLQQIGQAAAERRAEEERQETEGKLRLTEVETWCGELNRIIGELDAKIAELAPSSSRPQGRSEWKWDLNDAVLRVASVRVLPQPGASQRNVLAYSSIALDCRGEGYRNWAHSLWCYEVRPNVFEWWEIGFKHKRAPHRREALFALKPDDYSDKIREYFPLWVPIDPGEFIDRWIGWFADAAQGNLRPVFPEYKGQTC